MSSIASRRSPALPGIAIRFAAGGLVTAVFSGSLIRLAHHASPCQVLVAGLVIPSFTWIAQLGASAILMSPARRDAYWMRLGEVCLLGSAALLPTATYNWFSADPLPLPSIVNVVASVSLMAVVLTRRTAIDGTGRSWLASWCATIGFNMLLFLFATSGWWSP